MSTRLCKLAKPSKQTSEVYLIKSIILHWVHLKATQVAIKIRDQPKKVSPKSRNISAAIFRKMPVFSCSCGSKILIVPDVREMEKAIENHIVEHRKLSGQVLSRDILTQEILKEIIATINEN